MLRSLQLFGLLLLGLTVSVQIGCNTSEMAADSSASQSDDHDHDHDDHDHSHDPAELSFGAGIAKLEDLASQINPALAKDDADAVHDQLHDIYGVLEALSAAAKQHGVTEEEQKSVDQAVATLLDAYGEIDAAMHGEEGKSWDDVQSDVEAAVKTLTAFDHDHDHHDHGDHDHEGHDHDDETK